MRTKREPGLTRPQSPDSKWGSLNTLRQNAPALTIVLSAYALLTMHLNNTPAPHPTHVATLKTFESPSSGCDPKDLFTFAKSESSIKKLARLCDALYKDTDVALINYAGLNKKDATHLATGIENRVETTTQGLVSLDITVVEPSKAAKKLFEKETPEGCVDTSDIFEYGSYDAAVTMPDLKKYDKIIGISNDQDCALNDPVNNGVGGAIGVAYPIYNRYADVFEVADSIAAIKANDGKVTKEVTDDNLTVTETLPNPVDIASHEAMHLFGMGHSGTFYSSGSEMSGWEFSAENMPTSLDLDAYIAQGEYIEYGGSDIMGASGNVPKDSVFNTAEQYLMEWPDRTLDKKTSVKSINLDTEDALFNGMSPANSIAILDLEKSFSMPTGKGSEVSGFGQAQVFNQIAFVPHSEPSSAPNSPVDSVQVYVLSENNSVVSLGSIWARGEVSGANNFTLTIGGRIIKLDFDPTKGSVSIGSAL